MGRNPKRIMEYFIDEITRAENRPVDTGFFAGSPAESGHLYGRNSEQVTHDFLGRVLKTQDSKALIQVRNKFETGDILEFFGPEQETYKFKFTSAYNEKKAEETTICNVPMDEVWIELPFAVKENYLIRKG